VGRGAAAGRRRGRLEPLGRPDTGTAAVFPPYEIQEDLHPNYWAQLALRNCVTQAYNAGVPKGGTCTISGSGLNSAGEPNMSLR
jgi:hypothetical protein